MLHLKCKQSDEHTSVRVVGIIEESKTYVGSTKLALVIIKQIWNKLLLASDFILDIKQH